MSRDPDYSPLAAARPAPPAIPEHVLWTMTKGDRWAEARTRMVPWIGDRHRPELRFYVSSSSGTLDLIWSQIFDDGREVGELAEQKKKEFEAKGWIVDDKSETNAKGLVQ